jgi:hypothetical protein
VSALPPHAIVDTLDSTVQPGIDDAALLITELDYRILAIITHLRVVTQSQLERLHPEVSDRTLRYRTRRLRQLRLLGRTRPYRDRGSSPSHFWPTSRADALMRGAPPPRRGERRAPNPLFLAHTAAVSELYVVLRTCGHQAGLMLGDFHREGEARQSFEDTEGRPRAVAPDARVAWHARDGSVLLGHVELDLGTMSHARLRRKLDGYLDHARHARDADTATPVPALLFITTGPQRAATFLTAARRLRSSRLGDGARLRIAACASARHLGAVLTERSWQRADDADMRTLRECLTR